LYVYFIVFKVSRFILYSNTMYIKYIFKHIKRLTSIHYMDYETLYSKLKHVCIIKTIQIALRLD